MGGQGACGERWWCSVNETAMNTRDSVLVAVSLRDPGLLQMDGSADCHERGRKHRDTARERRSKTSRFHFSLLRRSYSAVTSVSF